MAESEVLSQTQFSRTSSSGDPANTYKAKAKFNKVESKTMRNSGGKLPAKQERHVHHRHNHGRTLRAR